MKTTASILTRYQNDVGVFRRCGVAGRELATSQVNDSPSRSVGARGFSAADPAVDPRIDEPVSHSRRKQNVIEPHSLISVPALELVIPKRPEQTVRLKLS